MGMIGNYLMVHQSMVDRIQAGKCTLVDYVYGEELVEDDLLDIDKTWHAISYTISEHLSGKSGKEIHFPLSCGQPLSDEDLGYGPALLINSEEVQRIASLIGDFDQALFRTHFSLSEMRENQVYPIVEEDDEDSFFSYVWPYFQQVQTFFQKAAHREDCVLFFIN